jgi:TetR/AcrR family transcriptional repressor of mexJK operon
MAVVTRQRGRPRLEEAAEIDNALLSTALREFIEKGFDKASMRSIAAAANVHRSTLLGRFPSKESLFRAIMTQQIERMAAATSLEFQGKPDLRRGLIDYANRALAYSLEGDYLEINRLIYASASRFPAVAAAAKRSTAVGVAQISEFINRCAEADGVACKDPQNVAECFTLLLRGWYAYAIINEKPVTAREREAWVEQMVGILVNGRSGW